MGPILFWREHTCRCVRETVIDNVAIIIEKIMVKVKKDEIE